MLPNVTITEGVAAHPLHSAWKQSSMLKVALDFWLLATATRVLATASSSFSRTALLIRDASDTDGSTLILHAPLITDARTRSACGGLRGGETRDYQVPRPLHQRLGCTNRGVCAVLRVPIRGEYVMVAVIALLILVLSASFGLVRVMCRAPASPHADNSP